MGCPTIGEIGKDITFSICTHDPDTGVLTDADGAVPYRVYEEDGDTPVATGNMDLFDSDDTDGFYLKKLNLDSVTYEDGKTYNIFIKATVGGDTGGIVYTFSVYDALKADVIKLNNVAESAAKLERSAKTIVRGTVSHDNVAATPSVFYCDDISEATGDHFNGRIIIFTSGNLEDQATDILDYELVGGEAKFTVTDLTEAADDDITFVIV